MKLWARGSGREGVSRSGAASSMVVTHRRPSAALTTAIVGTISSQGEPGLNGTTPRAIGTRTAGLVVVLDRREERRNVVDRDSGGDTSPGDTDTVADEQVAVAAGDVVEVDVALERSADGPHETSAPGAEQQLGDSTGELAMFGVGEAGGTQVGKHPFGRRQVGDALGQIAVGRAVAEQRTDLGHDLAEVQAVAPTDQLVAWYADVEQRDASAGAHHAAELIEERRQLDEVAQGEAARRAVDRVVGQR